MGQKTRDDAEQQLEKVGQQPLSSDSRDRFSLFFLCCCYCFQYRSDTFWFQGPLVRTTLRAHITYMPRSTYLLYHRWRGWGKKASKYLCCSLFPPIIQMIFLATSSVFFSLALSRSLYFSFPGKGKTLVFFFWFQQQLTSLSLSLFVRSCQYVKKVRAPHLVSRQRVSKKKKEKPSFFFFYLSPFLFSHLTLLREHKKPSFFFFFLPQKLATDQKRTSHILYSRRNEEDRQVCIRLRFSVFSSKERRRKKVKFTDFGFNYAHFFILYKNILLELSPLLFEKKKKGEQKESIRCEFVEYVFFFLLPLVILSFPF